MSPQILLPVGDMGPIQRMVPWAHASRHPKWHINQFSRFCRVHGCVQWTDIQTDKHTDHAASVAVGCIFALCACKQPKNWLQWIQAWGQGCHRRVLGKNIGRARVTASGTGVQPRAQPKVVLGWAWKGLDRVQSQTASRFSRVGMKIVGYEKAGCSEICVNGNKILRKKNFNWPKYWGGCGLLSLTSLAAELMEGLELSCTCTPRGAVVNFVMCIPSRRACFYCYVLCVSGNIFRWDLTERCVFVHVCIVLFL